MDEKKKIQLTDKQEAFCWLYVNHYKHRWNGRQCAILAGFSEHTASEIAYEYLRKPHVKARIEELVQESKESNEVLIQRVVEERKKLAFSDIKDFVEVDSAKPVDDAFDEEEETDDDYMIQHVRIKDLGIIDTSAIESIKETQNGLQIKLHSKIAALDGLAKYLGMDKIDVNRAVTINMIIDKDDAGL